MAIPFGTTLFESEATSKATVHQLGAAVKAGALVVLRITGKRSGAYLNIAGITDTQGNAWDWRVFQSEFRTCAIAWCRAAAAMTTSDKITVTLNGTPTYCWKVAETYEGASGTPIDEQTASGSGSTASVSVAVAGSDWLVVSAVMLPTATSGGLTPLNSGISRNDNGHSGSTPWAESFSRNGSGGSAYVAGATLPSSQQWSICAVSFPFLAMPASPARVVPSIIGI